MSETATQQETTATQEPEMAAMEAALANTLGNALGVPAAKPEPKEEPKADDGKARGEDGRFKPKDEAADKKDAKADEEEDAPTPEDEADFDPFAEDDAEPAPKPHQLDKGVQALQQELGILKRDQGKLLSVIEELRGELKASRAKQEPAADKGAKLRKLAEEGYIDESVVEQIIDLVGTPQEVPDLSSLQSEVSQLRAERAWDKAYPALAGQYGKAADLAWAAAQKRFPNLDPHSPTVVSYAQGKIHDIADSAIARINARKGGKKKPVAAESDTDPTPSTKGARPATAGVTRAPKPEPQPQSEEQIFADFEKRLAGSYNGQ